MPNSQAGDVEALRRELADLIVQWAGKSVKDDPESPLGAALTRAVRDAAREAVSEQHQVLSRREAESIAEAVARLNGEAHGAAGAHALPQKTLLAAAAVALALAALSFVVGLQVGRGSAPSPALAEPALAAAAVAPVAPPATEAGAPIAPTAPAAEPVARRAAPQTAAVERAEAPAPRPRQPVAASARPRRAAAPAGRPAPAATAGEAGGQPVTGARPTPPPSAPVTASTSSPAATP